MSSSVESLSASSQEGSPFNGNATSWGAQSGSNSRRALPCWHGARTNGEPQGIWWQWWTPGRGVSASSMMRVSGWWPPSLKRRSLNTDRWMPLGTCSDGWIDRIESIHRVADSSAWKTHTWNTILTAISSRPPCSRRSGPIPTMQRGAWSKWLIRMEGESRSNTMPWGGESASAPWNGRSPGFGMARGFCMSSIRREEPSRGSGLQRI